LRERELLDTHRQEWFRLLGRRPGFGNMDLRWWPGIYEEELADRKLAGQDCPLMTEAMEADTSRGFIDSIACCARDWLVHGDAIREQHPVRRVILTTCPDLKAGPLICFYNDTKQMPMNEFFTLDWAGHTQETFYKAMLAKRFPGLEFTPPRSLTHLHLFKQVPGSIHRQMMP
jgi:hypothetical protein